MAFKRVTMQDIADACGLSRNTVSKIFNERGTVPETTKNLVLQKAQELGYYQDFEKQSLLPESGKPASKSKYQTIALLTSHMPADYHFGTFFIPTFTEYLSRNGYTLTMYEISPEELQTHTLPSRLPLADTAGILCIEMFDKEYLKMLCALNIPIITVDSYPEADISLLDCDFISMENIASTIALTTQTISEGAAKLGFVGDVWHCNSFHERYIGFCRALDRFGLIRDQELCLLQNDSAPYDNTGWLIEQIRKMPVLPDAFICANDYLALHMISAIKKMGLSIPGDVMIAGFDGTPQSAVVEPSLSTVQIPSADIGRMAADMLLDRIQYPDRPFRAMYVKTVPILRNSTHRR